MAKKKYPEKVFDRPRNQFVFGKLVYKSKVLRFHNNKLKTSTATVSWNHHVAPIVEIEENEIVEQYILDPAVSPSPIKILDWFALLTQTTPSQITGYVTCKENALDVLIHDCLNSNFDHINNSADEKYYKDFVNQLLQA